LLLLRDQILEYKRRCEQMKLGFGAARGNRFDQCMSAHCAEYDEGQARGLEYLSAVCAAGGSLIVIWATTGVLAENARPQLII
jgi:hypothetical protein